MGEGDETVQTANDRKALEAFVVGNEDLERLEALLDRFNIFEAIGMVRQELRHSDFLAFLLDPRANHGLGDAFVKKFLQRVLMVAGDGSTPVTPIELELLEMGGMDVRREWRNIDILLLDEEHELAVIIENKIGSGERSGQLQRYSEAVGEEYPGWNVMGVYLTPGGDLPSREDYLPVGYDTVCEVIDRLLQSRASVINPDVKTLMMHYTEMLRRHIVGDSEIARLSRQIYNKHQRALDLIYEHRPDLQVDTRNLLETLIRNTEGLNYKGRHRNLYVFFFPEEWESPALDIVRDRHGFFRFVFANYPDELHLFLETSPGDEETRRRLFEMGQRNESLFNYLEDPEIEPYSKLYARTFLTPEFCEEATDEAREEEIRKQWTEFVEEDLPRLDAALKEEGWIWES